MSQNSVPEMIPSGTFRMPLPLRPWCTTFGIIWGNFGEMLGSFKMYQVFQCSRHFLAVSPKFPQIIPKVVHHGRRGKGILNVSLGIISGTPFWLILNFTDLGHCECTDHFLSWGNCREIGWENSGCT